MGAGDRKHGFKGRLYLSTSASSAAVPVGSIKSWSMARPTDKADQTAMGDNHMSKRKGLPDPSGKVSAYFDDTTIATLKSARDSADGAKFYLYPHNADDAKFWSGTALVDANHQADVKGLHLMDLTLDPATDDWTDTLEA